MLCGKCATVYFQSSLESLLQKKWSVSLRVWMHLCLVKVAGEIGSFSCSYFHRLSIEIILQPFHVLRKKLGTYDNNKLYPKCKSGA